MSTAVPKFRPLTPQMAILLIVAAAAWLVTIAEARAMGVMAGGMNLGLPAFIVMWTFMMAAMMLPSVAPVASMYSRSALSHSPLRLFSFGIGYLVVWTATGIPAFVLVMLAGQLASGHPFGATVTAVVVFALCGVYQLTPLKSRCLQHCRSPISLLLHYSSYRGMLRDLHAGIHHGAYCLGCCWALMVLFVALGIMNMAGMLVLALVVLLEKLSPRGERLARLVGVAAIGLAFAVIWIPQLAPGLRMP